MLSGKGKQAARLANISDSFPLRHRAATLDRSLRLSLFLGFAQLEN